MFLIHLSALLGCLKDRFQNITFLLKIPALCNCTLLRYRHKSRYFNDVAVKFQFNANQETNGIVEQDNGV